MTSDRISIDITDHVADVRLTRADKLNAIDMAMFEALIAAGDELAAQTSLRAVVLFGEGRAFCAGLDMEVISALLSPDDGTEVAAALLAPYRGAANRVQQAVLTWRDLPVPVIAAVHGAVYGGGFQLMLGADLRYAAPETKFSVMEIKWGLVPDMAGLPLMSELARLDIIRELTYSGRIFDAAEAAEMGFVTRVTADPRDAAHKTAQLISSRNPDAIRAAKRLMSSALPDLETRLPREAREQGALIGSANQLEAVQANLEKRPPRFR
ncbi:crotonase/enoyl-CoA hydratase family protein [Govanella unica]|uniref:Crotonase/enoyl-CoA hydratase family protein n=1 Tax=Govanella unica TaxID=2975056 RepID=A0A9X3TW89_9PROT|nr:crotonase/enoyl-CoA hydratase family protein [Govania unica]MDA5192881.1 crotonase/enoyl-CoA hydratase family protein [Govania unica]